MSYRYSFGLLTALALCAAPAAAQQGEMQHDQMQQGDMQQDAMGKDAMGEHGMAMDRGMTMKLPRGTFAGAEGHRAAGAFEFAAQGDKTVLRLASDFSVQKGPEVYVVLSPAAKVPAHGALFLGRLTKFTGPQTFDVPAGTDLKAFSHVVLWCKKYGVAMGTASLATADAMMHN